jgi:hypothetical protein
MKDVSKINQNVSVIYIIDLAGNLRVKELLANFIL